MEPWSLNQVTGLGKFGLANAEKSQTYDFASFAMFFAQGWNETRILEPQALTA